MRNEITFALVMLLAAFSPARSQTVQAGRADEIYHSNWVNKFWEASWILPPGVSGREYGIYHFRKKIQIDDLPDHFPIRVSADNRYRLFVNGRVVGIGPAQGTPENWFYDTYDLAGFLQKGENTIACQVWNYGESGPGVQMSIKTAFIMQGETEKEKAVNTDRSWKVMTDGAYAPLPVDTFQVREYIIVTPGDSIDGHKYPWGWEQPAYDDSHWKNAAAFVRGGPYGTGTDLWWQLVPRVVPFLKEDTIRFAAVRRVSGDGVAGIAGSTGPGSGIAGGGGVSGGGGSGGFLSGRSPLVIPAHASIKIILDQGVEMTAFPELLTSGGKDAEITLRYAEALMGGPARLKDNRNDIEGKQLYGVADKFIADGSAARLFRPLWFRSYRYVELTVNTQAEPLSILDIHGMFNHIEHPQQALFQTSDSNFNRILQTAWHTLDLCDKDYLLTDAYYEQLQYIGDNRIQALDLNAMGYDRGLVRNMIWQYFMSRTSEGLTQSRYPCAMPQVIPTYSLLWINMVHDYWKYYKDDAFIRQLLSGVNTILDWYEQKLDTTTGLVGKTEYFNFVDWTRQWPWDNYVSLGGVPPGCEEGGSSIASMQLAYALTDAAELFQWARNPYFEHKYKAMAARITKSVWEKCWDPGKQLLSDTRDKKWFSQHANIFGVLSNTIPAEKQRELIRRVSKDTSLVQPSLYFRFYLGQAYIKAGLSDEYLDLMGPWKTMLSDGLTTFAEMPGNGARSDCHPWSTSPLFEFYSTVCGIQPLTPGFSTVQIKPALGHLQWVRATMIHEGQPLNVYLKRRNGREGIEGEISLPGSLKGVFVWNGKEIALHPGQNKIRI